MEYNFDVETIEHYNKYETPQTLSNFDSPEIQNLLWKHGKPCSIAIFENRPDLLGLKVDDKLRLVIPTRYVGVLITLLAVEMEDDPRDYSFDHGDTVNVNISVHHSKKMNELGYKIPE